MDWISLVQQVGLPTAMLAIMGAYFYKKDQEHREDFRTMWDTHRAEQGARETKYEKLSEDNHKVMTEVVTMLRTFIDITKR